MLGYAHAGVRPEVMGIGPVPAVSRLLERIGLTVDDFDVIESNEAFAAQALAVNKGLGFDPARVNPNGGAIALGHPVGATGAIITIKALYELERIGGRRALVTMCIGGGQGIALAIERVDGACEAGSGRGLAGPPPRPAAAKRRQGGSRVLQDPARRLLRHH